MWRVQNIIDTPLYTVAIDVELEFPTAINKYSITAPTPGH